MKQKVKVNYEKQYNNEKYPGMLVFGLDLPKENDKKEHKKSDKEETTIS